MEKNAQPSEVTLKRSPFWIRLYNLPFGDRSNEKIRAISSIVGDVMEVEDHFLEIEQSRRVRVMLDITKPLKKMQKVRVQGGYVVNVAFKYERLPHFCFMCGMMSHTDRVCLVTNDEDKEKGCTWGLDIKASPWWGYNKNKEEFDLLKLKKKLFVPKPKEDTPPSCEKAKDDNPPIISAAVTLAVRGVFSDYGPPDDTLTVSVVETNPTIIHSRSGIELKETPTTPLETNLAAVTQDVGVSFLDNIVEHLPLISVELSGKSEGTTFNIGTVPSKPLGLSK